MKSNMIFFIELSNVFLAKENFEYFKCNTKQEIYHVEKAEKEIYQFVEEMFWRYEIE